MYVDIDKIRVNYTIKGEGKPVILLHGWGGSIHSLTDLQYLLSQNFQVVNLDLPGFGDSSNPPSAWGSSDYAMFVNALIDKLKLSSPILVGHSNGGRIAVRFAIDFPSKAKSIVLIDSSGIKPVITGKRKLASNLVQTGKSIFSLPILSSFEPIVKRTMYKSIGETDYLNSGEMKETFLKLINEDLENELEKINLPCLILWGKDDTQTPLWMGDRLNSKIKGSKLEVIENAGHSLPLKYPELVKNKILEWDNGLD
ncbi:alpha/beta hydrolase [Candidatus Dojkabacteria bacterium]|uniref:Alpha/beta hydrolase n=1 Tax=Candidatus Dojkabacteria bacterium TaxID=2099670 RepID=A0A955RHC6_9BACT|nr:alpha/beta hydrolase [Candidatus Dojkabacteria bacterium]